MQMQTGRRIVHGFTKTVTEGDHSLFCALTWNPQPLHANRPLAEAQGHDGVLVNGMYTLSLTLGASVYDLTMQGLVANLSIDEVSYSKPVKIGDTLSFETEIEQCRRSNSRPGQSVVSFRHFCLNQDGHLVMSCRRSTLMKGVERESRPVECLVNSFDHAFEI